MMRPTFSGFMNCGSGVAPGERGVETAGLLAAPEERGKELLHVRGRRGERGELAGEVVHRLDPLVATGVMLAERGLVRPPTAQGGVERVREALGVGERIADPLSGERVLVVAGVAGRRELRQP